MPEPRCTDQQVAQFHDQGYLLVPGLFSPAEMAIMLEFLQRDPHGEAALMGRRDGEGGVTKLRVWNAADQTPYGLIGRLPRIVDRMEQLLGGEVYLYHAKATIKEPFTGGAWAWHQDYGYWYNNGCLFPYMASCMIALDACTRENGCLQVLAGSHHMGRVEHMKVGDQTGADPARVEEARKVLPLVYVEMQPGDALFFHCNLLHRSDQNPSPHRRSTFICCYNAARNNPFKEHHHPRYHPLQRVPESALLDFRAGA